MSRLQRAYKEGGAAGLVRHLWSSFLREVVFFRARMRQREMLEQQDGFDRTYGTDTCDIVRLEQYDVSEEKRDKAVLYWPILPRTFRKIMATLEIPFEEFTFVDLGSGKGRALLLASLYPFRKIIGVEFSRALHEIAENNVNIFHPTEQHCETIELICNDACKYEYPNGPFVLYLFDPFERPVFEIVVDNLKRSLKKNPRDVWVVYLRSRCHDLFEDSHHFTLVHESKCIGTKHLTQEYDWRVYRGVNALNQAPG